MELTPDEVLAVHAMRKRKREETEADAKHVTAQINQSSPCALALQRSHDDLMCRARIRSKDRLAHWTMSMRYQYYWVARELENHVNTMLPDWMLRERAELVNNIVAATRMWICRVRDDTLRQGECKLKTQWREAQTVTLSRCKHDSTCACQNIDVWFSTRQLDNTNDLELWRCKLRQAFPLNEPLDKTRQNVFLNKVQHLFLDLGVCDDSMDLPTLVLLSLNQAKLELDKMSLTPQMSKIESALKLTKAAMDMQNIVKLFVSAPQANQIVIIHGFLLDEFRKILNWPTGKDVLTRNELVLLESPRSKFTWTSGFRDLSAFGVRLEALSSHIDTGWLPPDNSSLDLDDTFGFVVTESFWPVLSAFLFGG